MRCPRLYLLSLKFNNRWIDSKLNQTTNLTTLIYWMIISNRKYIILFTVQRIHCTYTYSVQYNIQIIIEYIFCYRECHWLLCSYYFVHHANCKYSRWHFLLTFHVFLCNLSSSVKTVNRFLIINILFTLDIIKIVI